MKQNSVQDFILTQVWLAEWDKHLTSNPVMVSVVGSNLTGGNFVFAEAFFQNFLMTCFLFL